MIYNLEIKNYKGFDRSGVYLGDLAPINYFVGENASGKSTVLDFIYDLGEKTDNVFLLQSGLDTNIGLEKVDIVKACSIQPENQWKNLFLDFLEKRILILDLLGYVLIHNSKDSHPVNQDDIELARQFLDDINIHIPRLNMIDPYQVDSEELSGGKQKIFNLVYSILFIHKIYGQDATILLEEPSEHLHPSWQKKLPEIFDSLYRYTGIQMFVATHSPFVISGVGVLTESQNEEDLSQKVYFLKDFKVAGKRGEISTKGRNGYWGRKVVQITSSMLGAGLMDLVSPEIVKITSDAPILVVCEGEGLDADFKIYNEIFRYRHPSVVFISARGSSQVERTFELLNEIKPGLSANFKMMMLRDRDHEFPSFEDVVNYEEANPNHRVLRRRAIECYVYTSEVAMKMMAEFGMGLSDKDKMRLDSVNEQIQNEVEQGVLGDSYKIRLEKAFTRATKGKTLVFSQGGDVMVDLARLITPDMQIYKELEKDIFG